MRRSSARRSSRDSRACGDQRRSSADRLRRGRLERRRRARPAGRRRRPTSRARSAEATSRWLRASISSMRCARLLRLGGRHLVRRNEAGVEALADIGDVRLRARHALLEHRTRGPRGDDGPERARDLEPQIGLRRRRPRRPPPRLRPAPRARARRCGRRCRSATADRAACGSCSGTSGIEHARQRPAAPGTTNGARDSCACSRPTRRYWAGRRPRARRPTACAAASRARASASRWLASTARACASSSVSRSAGTSCAAASTPGRTRQTHTTSEQSDTDHAWSVSLPDEPGDEHIFERRRDRPHRRIARAASRAGRPLKRSLDRRPTSSSSVT